MGRGAGMVQANGLAELGLGFGVPVDADEKPAEHGVRARIVRVVADGLAVGRLGPGVVALRG